MWHFQPLYYICRHKSGSQIWNQRKTLRFVLLSLNNEIDDDAERQTIPWRWNRSSTISGLNTRWCRLIQPFVYKSDVIIAVLNGEQFAMFFITANVYPIHIGNRKNLLLFFWNRQHANILPCKILIWELMKICFFYCKIE